MRASTRRELLAGPAGAIECAVDDPVGAAQGVARGIALIAHPHPLFGGTQDNKVVQALARAFVDLGYSAWRPNFRGVGASEGRHDEGRGEVDDLAAVVSHLKAAHPVLAGFSFGGAMQARLAQRLALAGNAPSRVVLVAPAVGNFESPPVPADSIVIHGAEDTTVPLATVLAWAVPQELPVVVVPGADHFFHRRLHIIRGIVERGWK